MARQPAESKQRWEVMSAVPFLLSTPPGACSLTPLSEHGTFLTQRNFATVISSGKVGLAWGSSRVLSYLRMRQKRLGQGHVRGTQPVAAGFDEVKQQGP